MMPIISAEDYQTRMQHFPRPNPRPEGPPSKKRIESDDTLFFVIFGLLTIVLVILIQG